MKSLLFLVFFLCSSNLWAQVISVDQKIPLLPIISVVLAEESIDSINSNSTNNELSQYLSLTQIIDGKLAPISVRGKYTVHENKIQFTPLYFLGDNLAFTISFKYKGLILNQHYATPDTEKGENNISLSLVESIFPAQKIVPRNILFFHVVFSNKMTSDISAYQYVKIFDETNNEIPNIWRQKSYWLKDKKTLILMIHPGRVKRGIEMSIPFEFGKSYTLVVSDSIKDIFGRKIIGPSNHTFTIGKEDYVSPKILFDEFELPKFNSKDELTIIFSEGMDHSSIIDGVKIYTENGVLLTGHFSWNESESVFLFTPKRPWKKGKYTVKFEKKVCDYASNRLNRLFEIEKLEDIEKDNIPVRYNFEL